jgi:hypothetical protein
VLRGPSGGGTSPSEGPKHPHGNGSNPSLGTHNQLTSPSNPSLPTAPTVPHTAPRPSPTTSGADPGY